ncbi:hypothetical protein PENTCL1PPCAC_24614 [Pristionchus entomophagus]|uniref:G protein-coupled receptor n=1 Tax=Pristionchus entomophagus TaxID=358040 RepID=A0AAV5U7S5_9BILA|nr:hypothetical protein PENTCL1PPCAC_24614 [Pristionchus entomophagus]
MRTPNIHTAVSRRDTVGYGRSRLDTVDQAAAAGPFPGGCGMAAIICTCSSCSLRSTSLSLALISASRCLAFSSLSFASLSLFVNSLIMAARELYLVIPPIDLGTAAFWC